MFKPALLLALVPLAAAAGAQAHELGQHPGVLAARSVRGIDPSTFIVGHPAGGRAGRPEAVQTAPAAPALGQHPAVLVARQAAQPRIDANAFLVQPPASVRWTLPADTALARSEAR